MKGGYNMETIIRMKL